MHSTPVDTGGAQDVDLLAEPGEPRRNRRPLEVLARLRLERDQEARGTEFLAFGSEVRQEHLVAVVDAIEGADRRHATLVARPDVVQGRG